MQRVRLIFATRVKLKDEEFNNLMKDQDMEGKDADELDMGTSMYSGFKMRVSLKPDWIYHLLMPPSHTIQYTLRKFKVCNDPRLEADMAEKYQCYRVQEDRETRMRYVHEIHTEEDAQRELNKKWSWLLICHKGLIKMPGKDFKNILNEFERKVVGKWGDDGSVIMNGA